MHPSRPQAREQSASAPPIDEYGDYPEMAGNKVIALDIVEAQAPAPVQAPPAQPAYENKPRIEIGPKAATLPEGLTAADCQPQHWIALFDQLNLSGMARNVASNCELREAQDGRLSFMLDEQRCKIFKPAHSKQIESALNEYFATELRVGIEPGSCNSETPFLYAQRQKAEQQQVAEDAIYNDDTVKAVISHFDAAVNPASITPRTVEKQT
jgi:DNA polymerase-3 subunit gamma/tau